MEMKTPHFDDKYRKLNRPIFNTFHRFNTSKALYSFTLNLIFSPRKVSYLDI